jgi:hypothetical protein
MIQFSYSKALLQDRAVTLTRLSTAENDGSQSHGAQMYDVYLTRVTRPSRLTLEQILGRMVRCVVIAMLIVYAIIAASFLSFYSM